MKKYITLYKATIMEAMQYAKGFMMNSIGIAIHVFIFFVLWQYLYSSGDRSVINGYTLNQMIWYVAFTEFLVGFSSSNVVRKTPTSDIMGGNIAYVLNKPYSYTGYIFSRYYAEGTIRGIINLLCSLIIGLVLIGPLEGFNVIYLPLIIITFFLGITIAALVRLIISYMSFWVENSEPFQWLYKTILLIFGVTFPLGMFPTWLQPIIRYSPVYTIMSGPVEMLIKFNMNTYIGVIVSQIIYIVILSLILTIEYKKGVKKVNVNGG